MDKIENLYNKKIITSGDRLEVYKYQSYQREGGAGNNKTGRKGSKGNGAETKEDKEVNRKKVLYRARNNIIRLISSNKDLNTFITLTFAKEPTIEKSKLLLKAFFKRLQGCYENIKYLYVLEFGSLKGRLHYHILTNFLLPGNIAFAKTGKKKSKEQREYENIFSENLWKNGFVDIRDLEAEGNSNIALYVSAYLVEDLFTLDLKNSKCYGYSRNLNKPIVKKINSENKDYVVSEEDYNLKFVNSYEINYTDKEGRDRKSKVVYSDYYKK